MTVKFLPPRVPLVDVRSGTITREWYLLFQELFGVSGAIENDMALIVGPISGPDIALVSLDRLRDDFGVAPVAAPIALSVADDVAPPPPPPLFFAADDVLPLINGLRDEVAMLRARMDDMLKGGPIL